MGKLDEYIMMSELLAIIIRKLMTKITKPNITASTKLPENCAGTVPTNINKAAPAIDTPQKNSAT